MRTPVLSNILLNLNLITSFFQRFTDRGLFPGLVRFYPAPGKRPDPKILAENEKDLRSFFELHLRDAWVWDMYRQTRFVASVRIVTFKDVNIEELPKKEL